MLSNETNITDKFKTLEDMLKKVTLRISGKNPDNIDKEYERLKKQKNNTKNRGQPKEWWDQECKEAIERRKAALSTFIKEKSLHSFVEYKKHRAIALKTINRKKRESFDRFCVSINRFSNISYVWNKMRVFKNIKKNIQWNRWTNGNREEEINKNINKLAPPYVIEEKKGSNTQEEIKRESPLSEKFKYEELTRALNMIRRNSAPGKDGVEYIMLKNLTEELKNILLNMYNEVWVTGEIPDAWRKYQVVFIDKPGKEKVRPIALSSCMGKLMERLVNERLIWWAEHEGILAVDQNGFRRGRSCVENLTKITTNIKTGLLQGQYTLAAFLDVSSAYDNVNYSILMDKLQKLECPTNIRNFIGNWLYLRDAEFIINSQETCQRRMQGGLPQGAVLSPIIYALYTSDITKDLNVDINSVQFADDIAIYTTNRDRNVNVVRLEEAVNTLTNRLYKLGLDLEPKKTVLVEFNKSGYRDKNISINIKNERIENSYGAKFLGIWLDNKLNFRKQINEVRGKVNKANSIMTYLNKKSKGMEVNTALMLYKSLVRSITEYGIFVYYPTEANLRLKLERVQYLGLRTAMGYRNSTPNNVIIAEAKVRLLRDRAHLLARNFLSKNLIYGERQLIEQIEEFSRKENYARLRQPMLKRSIITESWQRVKWIDRKTGSGKRFEIFETEYEIITNSISIDLEIGIYRKEGKGKDCALIQKICDKYHLNDKTEIIYTDGSKNKKGISTGAGIVIENREVGYNISLPNECSIFTAEAFAIKAAVEIMYREKENQCEKIVILSDSKSVLQALMNNELNVYQNRYIIETRKIIYKLKRELEKEVILIWIPAHVGIKGNEIADGLAKEATKETEDNHIEVPLRDYRKIFKIETWNMTQDSIIKDAQHKGKFYFENFYKREKRKPWFYKINAERYYVTLINRLRANHYNVRESLARKGITDSARCECGSENESIEHVIWRCSRYDEERARLDQILRQQGITEEIDIKKILRNKNWKTFKCIYKYIKKIDRII